MFLMVARKPKVGHTHIHTLSFFLLLPFSPSFSIGDDILLQLSMSSLEGDWITIFSSRLESFSSNISLSMLSFNTFEDKNTELQIRQANQDIRFLKKPNRSLASEGKRLSPSELQAIVEGLFDIENSPLTFRPHIFSFLLLTNY